MFSSRPNGYHSFDTNIDPPNGLCNRTIDSKRNMLTYIQIITTEIYQLIQMITTKIC